MKAVTIHKHGGLDCVRVEDIPEPRVSGSEVLVDVKASALNHLDIWVRRGRPGYGITEPLILGSDASGVVAQIGEGVHGINVGDEVILNPGLSCGCCKYCFSGQQSECERFGILGLTRGGTFAERILVPSSCIYPKPQHLSFEEAAALPLSHLTAWRMLFTRACLKTGETILIHGIGGGVALAALQLSKLTSAEVIVTSSSYEKLDRAKQIGANHTINYKTVGDVAEMVLEITNGRGADIAFDTVGASTMPINLSCLRKGGKIVICGVTSGANQEINLQHLYWKQISILGSTMGSHEDFFQMIQAVNLANIKPIIDSIEPLEKAPEAMARMEAGKQFGKIVLRID